MATIVATNVKAQNVLVTETTLGSSNTFTYRAGVNQTLVLRNATGGALTPVIDGASSTTIAVDGVGSVSVADGFAVGSMAAGAVRSIRTDSIFAYLSGTIDITGGTGLVATLLEFN